MLRIETLQKKYSKTTVLQLSNLYFEESINWIKGGNGSGKSTMLKCMAGIIDFKGDIFFNSISLKHNLRSYLKNINYSDTEPAFPDFLTGEQLISFYIKSKKGHYSEISELIGDFEMKEYLNNMPISNYSSGMLKKLSICLAFIGNPFVILLDEPFITLDVNSIHVLNNWLDQYTTLGKTLVITSHLEELPFKYNELNLDIINQKVN